MNPIKSLIIKTTLYILDKRLKDLEMKWQIIENTADNICYKTPVIKNISYETVRKLQNFSLAVRVNKTKTETAILKLKQELKNG